MLWIGLCRHPWMGRRQESAYCCRGVGGKPLIAVRTPVRRGLRM